MGDIYRLDFPSGKSYVGASKLSANKRFLGHKRVAMTSNKGVVYKAWREHGEPVLVVLATVPDELLCSMEIAAIAEHGTLHPNGYNETPGGKYCPVVDAICRRKNKAETEREKIITG